MTFEELYRKMRSGDRNAADLLEIEARGRGDVTTVALCWSVSRPPRFSAWKALNTALDAAGWASLESEPIDEGWSGEGFQSTALIRADVIAQAMVAACATVSRDDYPVARAMADLAERLLTQARVVDRQSARANIVAFVDVVQRIPFGADVESMMAAVATASGLMDALVEGRS